MSILNGGNPFVNKRVSPGTPFLKNFTLYSPASYGADKYSDFIFLNNLLNMRAPKGSAYL